MAKISESFIKKLACSDLRAKDVGGGNLCVERESCQYYSD